MGFAQEKEAIKANDNNLNEAVHIIAKMSSDQVSVDGIINIEYRLYVSQDVGISNWKLIEKPTYDGFSQNDIKLENLLIENVTYKGKPYRMVIIKKDEIKAMQQGEFNFEPLQLEVTAKVAEKTNTKEGLGFSMKEVILKMKSNALKINVKS